MPTVLTVTKTQTHIEEVVTDCTLWYLLGSIDPKNCIAAYQPIVADNFTESCDNIAAPGNGLPDGTYDAHTDPLYQPTWSHGVGWTFDGNIQYLTTDIYPGTTWTIICRFSGATRGTGCMVGFIDVNSHAFYLNPYSDMFKVLYLNGAKVEVSPYLEAGVIGFANRTCYRNGDVDGTMAAPGTLSAFSIGIGCSGEFGASPWPGTIAALALYDTELTPAQWAEVLIGINDLS